MWKTCSSCEELRTVHSSIEPSGTLMSTRLGSNVWWLMKNRPVVTSSEKTTSRFASMRSPGYRDLLGRIDHDRAERHRRRPRRIGGDRDRRHFLRPREVAERPGVGLLLHQTEAARVASRREHVDTLAWPDQHLVRRLRLGQRSRVPADNHQLQPLGAQTEIGVRRLPAQPPQLRLAGPHRDLGVELAVDRLDRPVGRLGHLVQPSVSIGRKLFQRHQAFDQRLRRGHLVLKALDHQRPAQAAHQLPLGEIMAVGMKPVDPGRMVLGDGDHIVPAFAGSNHVHRIVSMTLGRYAQAVEVHVGRLRQVVDEVQSQRVAGLQTQHRPAVDAIVGCALDGLATQHDAGRPRFHRHREYTVAAAVFGRGSDCRAPRNRGARQ